MVVKSDAIEVRRDADVQVWARIWRIDTTMKKDLACMMYLNRSLCKVDEGSYDISITHRREDKGSKNKTYEVYENRL